MTTATGKQFGVGLRYASVFELTSLGYPKAPSTTVYEGFQVRGPKAFDYNPQNARKINHAGEDRNMMSDFLPALESGDAELRVSPSDQDLIALLSGVKKFTVGEATGVLLASDKRGSEPIVGLHLYQQSKNLGGLRNWRSLIVPAATTYPLSAGMGDSPIDTRYQIALSEALQHLWGTALTDLIEGATGAECIELQTEGKPALVAWKGDGSEDTFDFSASKQALSTGKVTAWANGVLLTGDAVTKATTGLTFEYPPLAGTIITAFYEF